MTDDVRECARGPRCANAREGAGAYGPRAFCDTDENRIRTALANTPAVYAELRAMLAEKPRGRGGERVGTRVDAPSPLNERADEALTALSDTVFAWEERLRPLLGMPPAPAVSWARTPERLGQACRLLEHRLTALLALPLAPMVIAGGGTDERGGADAGLDILEAYRAADRVASPGRPVVAVPVSCPSCGGGWLLRRDGEESAWCGSCGGVVAAGEYRALVSDAAA